MRIRTLKTSCIAMLLVPYLATSQAASAQTTLEISSSDFGITDTFNQINSFQIDIDLSGNLVAGETYANPSIDQVGYNVTGTLTSPTPSGFPGFSLSRNVPGADFYDQSPQSGLEFSIDPRADLSDGLQLSELVGSGSDTILSFNARELNRGPGSFYPPELILRADGTGRLWNANNQVTPFGGNGPVDVEFGAEYISDLTFNPSSVTIATVPSTTVLKGDVNLDRSVTFLDISSFIMILLANGFQAEADCDCDGDVDFSDIPPFIDILAGN